MKLQRGLTLLEMLVAIAIFTMIGIASFEVLTRVKAADQSSERHALALEQLQRAHWTMERDFMQASIRQVRLEEGAPSAKLLLSEPNLLESDSEGVTFTRLGYNNPFGFLPRGTTQGVGYRVQEGRLERLHTLYPDVSLGTKPKVRVLLEHIDTLEFKFYSGSEWNEGWNKANQLPEAVEVLLESEVHGNLRWVFLMTGARLERAGDD